MNIFNTAIAATTATSTTSQHGSAISTIVMLVVFFVIFYFFILKPQQKKSKEQKNLLNSLKIGAEIVTIGGILGKISKIGENFVILNIATNTNILIQKNYVKKIVPNGTIKNEKD